jgi:uncharacterized membrane protein
MPDPNAGMSARKNNLKTESSWQQRFVQSLKNDLIAGLLVIIPLATTIWMTYTLATWVIDLLTRIPKQLSPFVGLHPILVNLINLLIGLTVPLAGFLLVGLMARNIFGQWLLNVGEKILQSIPLAGAVYKTLKQILETVLKDSSNEKFRRVVLLEYPRRDMWAIGFVTGSMGGEIDKKMQTKMLSVFVPTTPNPTTGWYALVPESDVITLSLSIEEAFKLVISAGIVTPDVAITTREHGTEVRPLVDLEIPAKEPNFTGEQI